jgi:hypothetical protein
MILRVTGGPARRPFAGGEARHRANAQQECNSRQWLRSREIKLDGSIYYGCINCMQFNFGRNQARAVLGGERGMHPLERPSFKMERFHLI